MKIKLCKIQRVTLCIYFFSLNFEVFNLLGIGTPAFLAGILYVASLLPNYKPFLKTSYIKGYLRPLIAFFIFLTVVSLFYVNDYSYYFLDVTILFNILLFWVLVNHERMDPGVIGKGFIGFALGGILLTVFFNMSIGIEDIDRGEIRIFGDNANAIGVRICVAVIAIIYNVFANNLTLGIWRYLLLIPIPYMIFFMLQTGSRKTFIGFTLAFLIGTLFYKTKRSWHKIVVLGLSVAFAIYFLQIMMQSELLMMKLIMTAEEGDLAGREEIWSMVVSLIQDNFIWGVGKTGYQAHVVDISGGVTSPHNVLLEVMAYTGIIGLVIYLYFLYKISWQAFTIYRKWNLLLPLLLLIQVYGLILGGQALNVKIVWAIFAFTVSTVFYTKEIYNQQHYKDPLRHR